jgi:hypothetical protein
MIETGLSCDRQGSSRFYISTKMDMSLVALSFWNNYIRIGFIYSSLTQERSGLVFLKLVCCTGRSRTGDFG